MSESTARLEKKTICSQSFAPALAKGGCTNRGYYMAAREHEFYRRVLKVSLTRR